MGMMNMMTAPPLQHQAQGPPPQAFVPLAMPAPSLAQGPSSSEQSDLINYLQKRSVDLPPDVQQRIQSESRKQGKRVIKDLQVSAKALGDARTAYEEALQARVQHVSTWKNFLAEAVRNWTEYAKMFEQHEVALQNRIATAKEHFQEAKEALDASKTSAGQVTEISDEEELPGDSETSSMQITASIQTLSDSLKQLSKEAEAIQIEGPAVKRPRIEEVAAGEEAKQHFS
jgi:flagellar motor protein MotB